MTPQQRHGDELAIVVGRPTPPPHQGVSKGDCVVVAKKLYKFDPLVELAWDAVRDAPDGLATNPITGGGYVKGLDSEDEQKALASAALKARRDFEKLKPPDCPPLPINRDQQDDCAELGPLGQLAASYGSRAQSADYDLSKIPSFKDHCRGIMADPVYRKRLLDADPSLLKRFPPKELIWNGRPCKPFWVGIYGGWQRQEIED